ncbi:MAG: zf-HC2 domain-containing protein [Planctomycetota bacterium]|nr:zf-HC2 domain-containing protein [Planctomycetota bacterium]
MNLPDLEQIDEQLTAYLDGELSPTEAAALERSLVDDERLRIRLAELRQAYDLLDEVPETPHNQRFTKSTLELVIKDLSATKQPQSNQTAVSPKPFSKPINKRAWPTLLALIAFCAVTGAVCASVVAMIETRRQLQELGLVTGIHGLKDVNEVSIAVKLSQEKELMAVLRQHFADKLVPAPPDSIDQRKSWVQSLTQKQVSRLDDGREKIAKLSREERTRLTAIENEIEHLPDHRQIQEAVSLIGLVLDGIGSSRRNEMDSMKSEQRYDFLREQIYQKCAKYYADLIPPSDKAELEKWDLETFRPALQLAMLSDLPIGTEESTRKLNTRELLVELLIRRRIDLIQELEPLVNDLLVNLSPTARKIIEGVDKSERMRVLNIWLYPTDTPLNAYDKMDKDARDRLDLSDPEMARRRLERRR